MINAVITSKDPYLLARFATDIMMDDIQFDSDNRNPFNGNIYLHTWTSVNPMFYEEGERLFEATFFYINDSNYLKTLEKVLS